MQWCNTFIAPMFQYETLVFSVISEKIFLDKKKRFFLSKNIIEAHGGKMWFESQENAGTSFYFSIPIKKI